MNLRIRNDGTVAVSAAQRVPLHEVDAFVAGRADWVESARRRVLRQRDAEEALPLPSKEEALAAMTALCRRYWPEFASICPGGAFPTIRVRDMTTRWGVCNMRTGTLTFSRQLLNKPQGAQEYVVVHEFSHFAVPNHSPAFWAVVNAHMPDWKDRRILLRPAR